MKRSLLERATLARRISATPPDPLWEQFRRDWTAFNAIYTGTKGSGNSEAGMVNRAILKFFDDADASACLNDIPADAVSERQAHPMSLAESSVTRRIERCAFATPRRVLDTDHLMML